MIFSKELSIENGFSRIPVYKEDPDNIIGIVYIKDFLKYVGSTLPKSKTIKDITPADTTDYIIEGTLLTHELKNGETIIQLAKKYYGDKRLWPYIVKYNWMKDYNNVAIGQMINIPVLKDKAQQTIDARYFNNYQKYYIGIRSNFGDDLFSGNMNNYCSDSRQR